MLYRRVIVFFFFLSSFHYSYGQQGIHEVKYLMEFDTSTCWYDCHIVVLDGFATVAPYRTLVSASYNVVTPTGTTIVVEEEYMPLKNNQTYTGTDPVTWTIGPSAIDVYGSQEDYHRISPSTVPAAQFNDMNVGDTIKLFSLSVSDLENCGTGVRLYINGVDYNNLGGGGDYYSGMSIGPFPTYEGNLEEEYSSGPSATLESIENNGQIHINTSINANDCQGAPIYEWSGPNGYSSTTEDVLVNPANPEDYGEYTLIVTDGIGCKDTLDVSVANDGPPAVNEVISSTLMVTPTYENISVHLTIEGDDNLNSFSSLEYRRTGTNTYLPGALTMRAHPLMVVDGSPLGMNFHAGSIVGVLPNTMYDVRITLTDSDGGSVELEETITTKVFVMNRTDSLVYVSPGNGGGIGTIDNPYLGLQYAIDNVEMGETIIAQDGVYGPFTVSNGGTIDAPIIIKSANLQGAVIEGQNTSNGIITIGTSSDSIQHITIEGFLIRNGKWGVDAKNTQFLSIVNCKIIDVDFGIVNRVENGWEHDQYIHNNEIIGRTIWPQASNIIPSERGVDLRGNINVVSYNTISNFGDGISLDGIPYKTCYALDIHHNLINKVVDDLIEVDGVVSNCRVYNNYGINGRAGVSLAPVFGGPAYVYRNILYNMETSAFKMNRSPAGLVIVNNTIAKADRGLSSPSGWQNTIVKNNAILSSHYSMEEFGLVDGSSDEWDYNGYLSKRLGTNEEPWFKFDGIRYNDVSAINTSEVLEANGIAVSLTDFVSVSIPALYTTEAIIDNLDFNLTSGSSLLDKGLSFDNLITFSGSSPDIGAFEFGEAEEAFGSNFSMTCWNEDDSNKTWIGEKSEGWFDPQNWSPCGVPTHRTDVIIPNGTSFVPFVNTNSEIKGATIHQGASLMVNNGAVMRLKG